MRHKIFFCLLLFTILGKAQEIIPLPNSYKSTNGSFQIPKTITISASETNFAEMIPAFSELVGKLSSIKIVETKKNGVIKLVNNPNISDKEAYKILINNHQIIIEAGYPGGCFYGLQSLVQLLQSSTQSGHIACADIEDIPRYKWRGLMLDESRHFFGIDEVKKILDMMAMQKLNKFHWHLTDSQGWRIEIKKYPLLTSIGGKGNNTEPDAPAMFYTQQQILEIVRYAEKRHIEIIPEIDMPGHATAAAKAYPEFSGGGSQRYPNFTFNPGKDGTYQFLTNILQEVAGLFPSDYIHIGGDEVSFGNLQWADFREIQQLMRREKLKDLLDVEHYFLKRMADSIQKMGKTTIGWDEVIDAGLPGNTVVMWWRHDRPQILAKAITNGYNVILCPRIPLYFDFVQNESHKEGRKWGGKFAPLVSVYNFPSGEFTGDVSIVTPLVKGIQANLWTETVHSTERLEFMIFPRLSALSESAWTNQDKKNFQDFTNRMKMMEEIYQKLKIGYYDFRNPENAMEIKGPNKPKSMVPLD